jgi:hypothetical protein
MLGEVYNQDEKRNVELGKKKTNITLIGEGMESMIVTGRINHVVNSNTFDKLSLKGRRTNYKDTHKTNKINSKLVHNECFHGKILLGQKVTKLLHKR